jgi:hypothetical protein
MKSNLYLSPSHYFFFVYAAHVVSKGSMRSVLPRTSSNIILSSKSSSNGSSLVVYRQIMEASLISPVLAMKSKIVYSDYKEMIRRIEASVSMKHLNCNKFICDISIRVLKSQIHIKMDIP